MPFGKRIQMAGLKSLPGTAIVFADSRRCGDNPATILRAVPGVYADLVTVAGFKPVVASEKAPGGFDSLPLPWGLYQVPLQLTRNPAKTLKLNHFLPSELLFQTLRVSRHFVPVLVDVA